METSEDATATMPTMRFRSNTVSSGSNVAQEFPEMKDQSFHQNKGTGSFNTTELQEDSGDNRISFIRGFNYRSRLRSSGLDDSLKMIKQRRYSALKSMFLHDPNSTRGWQTDNGGGGEHHSRPTMSARSISAPPFDHEIEDVGHETVDSRDRSLSLDSATDFDEEIYHLENSLRLSQILADKKVTFYIEALLHDAIQRDDLDELCDLLNEQKDLDLEKPSSFGLTPLHRAAIEGSYRCLNLFLSRNVNVKVRDSYGWTPLHDAIYHGHIRCSAALITAGANVEAETNDFTKPIEMAHDDEMLLLIGRAMTSPGYVYDPDRETLV